ncbi:MAG TPA: hypothetical protein VFU05_03485 [Cyclobacteriaceae bacterium]|nr:hypothetical protein [Cyclobacteriaceae bacterium]
MDKKNSLFFFQTPDFIFRNQPSNIVSFSESNGVIYFTLTEDALISLEKSPFGGFVFSNADFSPIDIILKKLDEWSDKHKIKGIVIRCFPEIYEPELTRATKSRLLENGFKVLYKDITQIIAVKHGVSVPFNQSRNRRLKRCMKEGLIFKKLTFHSLEEAFSLIIESRNNKGYPVTMGLEELKTSFNKFPDNYLLFGVFQDAKMIATAVSIKVSDKILYYFYAGDSIGHRYLSPTTLLVHGIYGYCLENKFELIDLGISTHRGKLNSGLYEFKKSLGSFDSEKLTFKKEL